MGETGSYKGERMPQTAGLMPFEGRLLKPPGAVAVAAVISSSGSATAKTPPKAPFSA